MKMTPEMTANLVSRNSAAAWSKRIGLTPTYFDEEASCFLVMWSRDGTPTIELADPDPGDNSRGWRTWNSVGVIENPETAQTALDADLKFYDED